MTKVIFDCDNCGKQYSTHSAWYKKRKNHYCSRECKDAHHKVLYGSGLSRAEYEKQYWARPENSERRKVMSKQAHQNRSELMGDSYKKMILLRCKKRAADNGMEFDIEISDIVIPKKCPILGIDLIVGRKKGGEYNSPSLDRLDNTKGYIKGNVHVISKRANVIKSDASIDEIRFLYHWLTSCQTEGQK